MEGGKVFRDWTEEIFQFIRLSESNAAFSPEMVLLKEALDAVVDIAAVYASYYKDGKQGLIPLTSTRFLDCMAEVAVGHLLLEQGLIAQKKLEQGGCSEADVIFYKGKLDTVRYYVRNFVTQVFGRARIIKMEDTSAISINEESL
jgi:hypothetical protein